MTRTVNAIAEVHSPVTRVSPLQRNSQLVEENGRPAPEEPTDTAHSLHGAVAARRQAITELLFFASVGDRDRCALTLSLQFVFPSAMHTEGALLHRGAQVLSALRVCQGRALSRAVAELCSAIAEVM